MRFANLTITQSAAIAALDQVVIRHPEPKSLKILEKGQLPWDNEGQLWATKEELDNATSKHATWTPVKINQNCLRGEIFKWDEPLQYQTSGGNRVGQSDPRCICAKFMGQANYAGAQAFVFIPLAIRGDKVLRDAIVGRPLLRPVWFFRSFAPDVRMHLLDIESEIEKSIRMAWES